MRHVIIFMYAYACARPRKAQVSVTVVTWAPNYSDHHLLLRWGGTVLVCNLHKQAFIFKTGLKEFTVKSRLVYWFYYATVQGLEYTVFPEKWQPSSIRGVREYDTNLHMMVWLRFKWLVNLGVLLHCHYFQVHFNLDGTISYGQMYWR